MIRVFLFSLVLVLALFGVWWMPFLGGFVAFLLGSGIEIVAIGIFLDITYHAPETYTGLATGFFVVLYALREVFRKHLF